MLSIVSADRDNNNELIVDKVIRVWLCRRLYDSRWPPTPFKVDFFLPPQIPDYEIPDFDFERSTLTFDYCPSSCSTIKMSSGLFSQIFGTTLNSVFKRFTITLFKTLLSCLISLLFVQLPTLSRYIMALGKENDTHLKQKRLRAKLTDDLDPPSPYRAVEVLNELQTRPEEDIETLADIPDMAVKRFADRETMGVREVLGIENEKQPNGKVFKKFILGEYKFTTYREAHNRIGAIGRGFLSLGLKKGDRIMIFAETRPEWILSAFAAFRHGLTVVTLYSTLGEDAARHGIEESEVSVIVTSQELIEKLDKTLEKTPKVRHVIYFPGSKPQAEEEPKNKNNVKFHPLAKFEEQGKNADIDEETLKQKPSKTDVAVIMYTSGSTGTPKGVLLKHENVVAAMTGQRERVFPIIDVDNYVYVAYLPLAHILELSCELLVYYSGMKCGYSSPQTLTDQSTAIKKGHKGDLQVLRPHVMSCVPAILDRIHKTVNEKINQANFFQRQLFYLSCKIKAKRLEQGFESSHLDQWIFSRFNQLVLGGRVRAMLCGGAILSEDTQRFIQATLCVKLFQGYGLTETCAAGTIADQYDTSAGRAGYPLVCCEIRLENWDEGRYKNTDKPNPRGEIVIGGKVVAAGYFGNAEQENNNFKEINGTLYFRTGDIGEFMSDGTIKIIDRKKDLVKLRGGEYVSLTKVEMSISKLPFIENCCLCASLSAEYTILLVCANNKYMGNYTEKHFGNRDWQKMVDDQEFNEQILKEIQDACKKGGIQSFEMPQRVRVVTESWTPETGVVTDALKLKRKAVEEKYKDDIEALYKDEQPKKTSLKEKKSPAATSGAEEKKEPSTATLKRDPMDVSENVVADDENKKKDA
ncbi:unnamed protein product [Rotaria magnacalcarata]